ncbi:MAG: hypothetical protein J7L19_06845 [Dehalococcoidia bacterium]|nr:hypothetical protein [Dehalococcoidia bacterium]
MSKSMLACLMACLLLFTVAFSGLANTQLVMAKSEEANKLSLIPPWQASPSEEEIQFNCKYPIQSGTSDSSFSFNVELKYVGGEESQLFDLSAEGPPDWMVRVQQTVSGTKELPAVVLDPTKTYSGESVVVIAFPPYWVVTEPGDYNIKLKAASGDLEGSIDLTARVTARYEFKFETDTGLLNTKATAGKESHLTVVVSNTGTANLDKVMFSSGKPSGIGDEHWDVTFNPDKLEGLKPLEEQEVDVIIKPPAKTIAGDYMITLRSNSDPSTSSSPELKIRVTVGTSTKWGWIGAGIIVAVLAGLVLAFRKLGRK